MGDVLMLIQKAEDAGSELEVDEASFGLPVKLVGVGDRLDDLRPFDARDYANALIYRSTANAMLTVVRYMLILSFSTSALIEITSTPWIPRSVFDAS